MELDATFKTRDGKKERQLREKLCFNCDKPGHMARDCKQPRRNNAHKFKGKGRQLNATWKGRNGYNEIAATTGGQFDWVVTNQDIEAFLATAGQNAQDESDDSFTVTSLTPSEQEELSQLTATAETNKAKEATTAEDGSAEWPTLEELKKDPEFWKFVEQDQERRARERVADLPSYVERH
jgi:hypothetical protein